MKYVIAVLCVLFFIYLANWSGTLLLMYSLLPFLFSENLFQFDYAFFLRMGARLGTEGF